MLQQSQKIQVNMQKCFRSGSECFLNMKTLFLMCAHQLQCTSTDLTLPSPFWIGITLWRSLASLKNKWLLDGVLFTFSPLNMEPERATASYYFRERSSKSTSLTERLADLGPFINLLQRGIYCFSKTMPCRMEGECEENKISLEMSKNYNGIYNKKLPEINLLSSLYIY